jgi:hypothetical protein
MLFLSVKTYQQYFFLSYDYHIVVNKHSHISAKMVNTSVGRATNREKKLYLGPKKQFLSQLFFW